MKKTKMLEEKLMKAKKKISEGDKEGASKKEQSESELETEKKREK